MEFGEKVMYRKKNKHKAAKIEPRWEKGIFVGVRVRSGEFWISTAAGVKKVRSIRRLARPDRWSEDSVKWVRHVPWHLYHGDVGADGDIPEEQAVEPEPLGPARLGGDQPVVIVKTRAVAPREFQIRKEDAEKHGYTRGCAGCSSWFRGLGRQPHNPQCRAPFEGLMAGQARFENAERRKREYEEKIKEKAEKKARKEQARGQRRPRGDESPGAGERLGEEQVPYEDHGGAASSSPSAAAAAADIPSGSVGKMAVDGDWPTMTASKMAVDDEWSGLVQKMKKARGNEEEEDRLEEMMVGLATYGDEEDLREEVAECIEQVVLEEFGGYRTNVMDNRREHVTDDYQGHVVGVQAVREKPKWADMDAEEDISEYVKEWGQDLTAYDDVHGGELELQKVIEARAEELEYMRSKGIWVEVRREEAEKLGKKPVTVKRVDTKKSDGRVRSRLVARDFKVKYACREDLFAATR